VSGSVGGRPLRASYFRGGGRIHLWLENEHFEATLKDPRAAEYTLAASAGDLTTPLPGVVVAVNVEKGQQVQSGDVLMVIEAMKMEHTITAPYAGTVTAVHFARGARVPEGSALLELTPEGTVKKSQE
jgi:3-methylcrotonyl-CoA carboxylase alpha subunit